MVTRETYDEFEHLGSPGPKGSAWLAQGNALRTRFVERLHAESVRHIKGRSGSRSSPIRVERKIIALLVNDAASQFLDYSQLRKNCPNRETKRLH